MLCMQFWLWESVWLETVLFNVLTPGLLHILFLVNTLHQLNVQVMHQRHVGSCISVLAQTSIYDVCKVLVYVAWFSRGRLLKVYFMWHKIVTALFFGPATYPSGEMGAWILLCNSDLTLFAFCAGEPSPTVVSHPSQGHGGVRVRPCQFQEEGLGSEPRLLAGSWVSGPGSRGAAVSTAYGG